MIEINQSWSISPVGVASVREICNDIIVSYRDGRQEVITPRNYTCAIAEMKRRIEFAIKREERNNGR